ALPVKVGEVALLRPCTHKSRSSGDQPGCCDCATPSRGQETAIIPVCSGLIQGTTAVRNAEDRSCAPCHARGKVETNDVVFKRNLACTPAGICSTSTWRRVRPNGWF